MVGHGVNSAGSNFADPASPISSHCAGITIELQGMCIVVYIPSSCCRSYAQVSGKLFIPGSLYHPVVIDGYLVEHKCRIVIGIRCWKHWISREQMRQNVYKRMFKYPAMLVKFEESLRHLYLHLCLSDKEFVSKNVLGHLFIVVYIFQARCSSAERSEPWDQTRTDHCVCWS